MIRFPFRASLLTALVATASSVAAQSGTATFGGVTNINGALPTVSYSGPTLSFSSQVLTGFGNQAQAGTASSLWWTQQYSGQGMLYGNNSIQGNVLEVRFEAASGFDLFLNGALFGGWPNISRNVSYRLFSDDYLQSTALQTVTAGTVVPATASFGTTGWGNAIRLQFTESDLAGNAAGRGAFDVGVQDIDYTVRASQQPPGPAVPEPDSFVLLAVGLAVVALRLRRRRPLQS